MLSHSENTMAAQVGHSLGLQSLPQAMGGDFNYSQLAMHFQSSIANMTERQANPALHASRCAGCSLRQLETGCLLPFALLCTGRGPARSRDVGRHRMCVLGSACALACLPAIDIVLAEQSTSHVPGRGPACQRKQAEARRLGNPRASCLHAQHGAVPAAGGLLVGRVSGGHIRERRRRRTRCARGRAGSLPPGINPALLTDVSLL